MKYQRAKVKGGTYFFTVVTFMRVSILTNIENVKLLRSAFKEVMKKHPFVIDAFVLLPDHMHCIWTLPEWDNNFSTRWRLVKSYFTRNCDAGKKHTPNKSRTKKKEQTVWQRRFWEHLIRNERDFIKHVEYIHYNPVKHGYVDSVKDWEYSSFKKFVRIGKYDNDWGEHVAVEYGEGIGGEVIDG